MKTLCLASTFGVMFGLTQPMLAQSLNMDPMPWTAQLGVCGGCLTIVLLLVTRVIPKMAEKQNDSQEKTAEIHREAVEKSADIHAAAINELGDKMETVMDSVRAEIRAGNDSQLALLRNALHNHQEPPKS